MTVKSKKRAKCQCNLCDCGRHRCEVHAAKQPEYKALPGDPDCFKTCYQKEFLSTTGHHPPKPCLPVLVRREEDSEKLPFYGTTEFSKEYKEKLLPPKFVKEKEIYERPEGIMDMMTTKSADYTVKDLAKTESFKPNQSAQRPKTLPQFEGETTSKAVYKAYDGCQRQRMCSEHPINLKINSDKFVGVTTAKQSYPAYSGASRVQPIRPVENSTEAGQEFYGVTTNNSYYKGTLGSGPAQIVVHHPSYKPPAGEMSAETTSRSDFNNKNGQRAHPILPQSIREPPPTFHGQTTNMDTYPAHPPQDRPKPKEKEKYVPPTEKFNVNSVHREMFKPFSVQRRTKLSPINKSEGSRSAPVPKFQGMTTHRDQFKKWQVCRQKAYCEPPRLVTINAGTMNTKTMQQSDFVYDKEKVERALPIVPDMKVVKSDLPIDALTSYRNEFRGLQNKCRLADILMNNSQQKLKA